MFVVGPTLFILKFVIGATGHYIQHLPETSLRMFTFSQEGSNWISTWTLFYWGWWIAWSPFVGMTASLYVEESEPANRTAEMAEQASRP